MSGIPLSKFTQIVDEEGRPTQYFINFLLNQGYSGTVTTAKLTNTGANGSMTFAGGVLVRMVAAT
jgi:hypothetical protein